jgi:hypothetical protein
MSLSVNGPSRLEVQAQQDVPVFRPLELACPPDTQAFHWRPRTAAGHRGHLSSNTISPFVRHWTNGRR